MANIINELTCFQAIPRELIFDNSLSDRARFVYVYMVSKPDNWDFFLDIMAKEIGYGKDTLRKYINELVNAGWLVKGEQSNENGHFGAVQYTIKAARVTDTEKYRHGKNTTHKDKDIIKDKDNDNIKEKEKTKKEEETDELFNVFNSFCSKYRKFGGRVRGAQTEFENLKKKHKDWKAVIPMLDFAIENENKKRNDAERRHEFYPQMQNLQTYINQRTWEAFVDGYEDYNPNDYHPEGFNYDEEFDAYRFCDYIPNYDLKDGYKESTRPDGARIVEQCNVWVWSAREKRWNRSR